MSLTGPSSTSPTAHAWWPTSWSLPTYSLSQQRRMRFIFAVLFWVLFAYLRGLVIAICVASVAEECRKTCIKHFVYFCPSFDRDYRGDSVSVSAAQVYASSTSAILFERKINKWFRGPWQSCLRDYCMGSFGVSVVMLVDNQTYFYRLWPTPITFLTSIHAKKVLAKLRFPFRTITINATVIVSVLLLRHYLLTVVLLVVFADPGTKSSGSFLNNPRRIGPTSILPGWVTAGSPNQPLVALPRVQVRVRLPSWYQGNNSLSKLPLQARRCLYS